MPDISIVIPLYNEEESLAELNDWIRRVMLEEGFSYEVIFVDDGSTDGSWHEIEKIASSDACVRAIKLRGNQGKSIALRAGFRAACGNVVFTMDADLQDSPDELPEMYRMITRDGYDMVSGWKKSATTLCPRQYPPNCSTTWRARLRASPCTTSTAG